MSELTIIRETFLADKGCVFTVKITCKKCGSNNCCIYPSDVCYSQLRGEFCELFIECLNCNEKGKFDEINP